MKVFIFGIGYSAKRFVEIYCQSASSRGDDSAPHIAGTVRGSDKIRHLRLTHPKLEVYEFDGVDGEPEIERRISEADAILLSIPPLGVDPALVRYEQAIGESAARVIIYLSTIGVYGDHDGAWVTEATPPAPQRFPRIRARIEMEQAWLDLCRRTQKQVYILRLAGIYGPGRSVFDQIASGSARRIVKQGQIFNRIHVDDVAQTIARCLETPFESGIFNVVDDEPAPPQDVMTYAAKLIDAPPPPRVLFPPPGMTPMAAQFWSANKRVSNKRLREGLNIDLRYPSYREGLQAIALHTRMVKINALL